MKKNISLLVLSTLALALTACGGDSATGDSTNASSVSDTTVTAAKVVEGVFDKLADSGNNFTLKSDECDTYFLNDYLQVTTYVGDYADYGTTAYYFGEKGVYSLSYDSDEKDVIVDSLVYPDDNEDHNLYTEALVGGDAFSDLDPTAWDANAKLTLFTTDDEDAIATVGGLLGYGNYVDQLTKVTLGVTSKKYTFTVYYEEAVTDEDGNKTGETEEAKLTSAEIKISSIGDTDISDTDEVEAFEDYLESDVDIPEYTDWSDAWYYYFAAVTGSYYDVELPFDSSCGFYYGAASYTVISNSYVAYYVDYCCGDVTSKYGEVLTSNDWVYDSANGSYIDPTYQTYVQLDYDSDNDVFYIFAKEYYFSGVSEIAAFNSALVTPNGFPAISASTATNFYGVNYAGYYSYMYYYYYNYDFGCFDLLGICELDFSSESDASAFMNSYKSQLTNKGFSYSTQYECYLNSSNNEVDISYGSTEDEDGNTVYDKTTVVLNFVIYA